MGWEIEYLDEDSIVFIKVVNPVTFEGTTQICREATKLAGAYKTHRYLVDHRDVDVVMPVSDIVKVPNAFREIGTDFEGKTAILLDFSAPKYYIFELLKKVMGQAWLHFELFHDKERAVAWLRTF